MAEPDPAVPEPKKAAAAGVAPEPRKEPVEGAAKRAAVARSEQSKARVMGVVNKVGSFLKESADPEFFHKRADEKAAAVADAGDVSDIRARSDLASSGDIAAWARSAADIGGESDPVELAAGTKEEFFDRISDMKEGGGATKTVGTTRPNVGPGFERELVSQYDMLKSGEIAKTKVRAMNHGIQADFLDEAAATQAAEIAPILLDVNRHFDNAERQLTGIQEMIDDVLANRINPGQFFANIGDAGVFAASMAMAAGHLASVMGGGPNTALSVINGAIERNMRAQEVNQAHDRAVLNSQIQIFDRLRALGVDRLNQANVYNALLMSQAETILKGLEARSASQELRAGMPSIIAEIGIRKMDSLLKIKGSVTSQLQIKIAGEGQKYASKLEQAAEDIAINALRTVVSGEAWGGLSLEQKKAEALNAMNTDLNVAGVFLNPEQTNRILAGAVDPGAGPTGEDVSIFAGGVSPSQVGPAEEGEFITVQSGGAAKKLRLSGEFHALGTDEAKTKRRRTINVGSQLVSKYSRLVELSAMGIIAGTGRSMKDLVQKDKDGSWGLSGVGSNAERRLASEFLVLTNQVVRMSKEAQSGKLEAMTSIHEPEVWTTLTALLPTDKTRTMALLFGDGLEQELIPALASAADEFYFSNVGFAPGLKRLGPPPDAGGQ